MLEAVHGLRGRRDVCGWRESMIYIPSWLAINGIDLLSDNSEHSKLCMEGCRDVRGSWCPTPLVAD